MKQMAMNISLKKGKHFVKNILYIAKMCIRDRAAPAEGEEAVEPISPEMNKYLNKVEDVLDGMSDQMEQLNDMEAFLKASFGEYDPADFEDDEMCIRDRIEGGHAF